MPEAKLEPITSFSLEMDDGAELLIRQHGNPGGVRLFVSNGNGFAIDGYRVFWEPLLEGFELILFDMRNHGRNQPTGADGHHYLQMARDLGSVFAGVGGRLGSKTSVGIFHSMSARAAMKHAVEIGWCWDALVLFDPPNVPPRGHRFYDAMRDFELRLVDVAMKRTDRFDSPDELARSYASSPGHKRWVAAAHDDMARAVLRRDEATGGWALSCQRELEASIYLAALTLDLWPPIDAYGGPVKLIGADPNMRGTPPTAHANRSLHEEFGYPYVAIEEAGHMLQIEKPEACRKAVLSFLKGAGITA